MACNGTRTLLELLRPRAAVDTATKDLLERPDASALSQVYTPRDGSCADIVPIWIIGGQLLVGARLAQVSPLWHLDLADTFQVRGICYNEVAGRHVLDTDASRSGLAHVTPM